MSSYNYYDMKNEELRKKAEEERQITESRNIKFKKKKIKEIGKRMKK